MAAGLQSAAPHAQMIGGGGAAGEEIVPGRRQWFLDFITSVRTERALRFVLPIPLLVYLAYTPQPALAFSHLGFVLYVIMAALLPPVMAMAPVLFFCAVPAIVVALVFLTVTWAIWVLVPLGHLSAVAADSLVLVAAFGYFLIASSLKLGPLSGIMTIAYYAVVYGYQFAAVMTKNIIVYGVDLRMPPFTLADHLPGWVVHLLPAELLHRLENHQIDVHTQVTEALLGDIASDRGMSRLLGAPIHVFGSIASGIRAVIPSGTYIIRYVWESEGRYGVISAIVIWAFISYAAFVFTLFLPPFRSGTALYNNAISGCHDVVATNTIDFLRRLCDSQVESTMKEATEVLRFLTDEYAGGDASADPRVGAVYRPRTTEKHATALPCQPTTGSPVPATSRSSRRFSFYTEPTGLMPGGVDSDETDAASDDFNPYFGYDITRRQSLRQAKRFATNKNVTRVLDIYSSYRSRFNLTAQSLNTLNGPLLLSLFEYFAAQHLLTPMHNFTNDIPERLRLSPSLLEIAVWLYIIQLYSLIDARLTEIVALTGRTPRASIVASVVPAERAALTAGVSSSEDNAASESSGSCGSKDIPTPERQSSLHCVELICNDNNVITVHEDGQPPGGASETKVRGRSESKFVDLMARQRDRKLSSQVKALLRHSSVAEDEMCKTNSLPEHFVTSTLMCTYHSLRLSELNDNSKHSLNENYSERQNLQQAKQRCTGFMALNRPLVLLYKHGLLRATNDLLELRRDAFIQLRTKSWLRALISGGSLFIGLPLFLYSFIAPSAQHVRRWWMGRRAQPPPDFEFEIEATDAAAGCVPKICLTLGRLVKVDFVSEYSLENSKPLAVQVKLKKSRTDFYALRLAVGNLLTFGTAIMVDGWRSLNLTQKHIHEDGERSLNLEQLLGTKYAGWACIGFLTTVTETSLATTKRALLRGVGVLLGTLSAFCCLCIHRESMWIHSAWVMTTCFAAVWLTAHPANSAIGFDPNWGYAAQLFTYQQVIILGLVAVQKWDVYEIVVSRLVSQIAGIGLAVFISTCFLPTHPSKYIRERCVLALQAWQFDVSTQADHTPAAFTHLNAMKAYLLDARRCIGDNEFFVQLTALNVSSRQIDTVECLERLYHVHLRWRTQLSALQSRSPELTHLYVLLRTYICIVLSALQWQKTFESSPDPFRRKVHSMSLAVLRSQLLAKIRLVSSTYVATTHFDEETLARIFVPIELFELDRLVRLIHPELI